MESFPELESRLYNDEAYVFQNDYAISHKAPIVQRWKADHAIRTIDWTSQIPDQNIVKNIWAYV